MRTAIFILIAFLVGYACYSFGSAIPFSEQWIQYEALRTTASIIFGVMGAWIAIVYPKTLTKILDRNNENKKEEISKISRLLKPLAISTLILASVLVIGIAAPILKQIDFINAHADVVRGISFAVLGTLTLAQLWALIASIAPGEHIVFELKREEGKSDLIKKLKSNIKQK